MPREIPAGRYRAYPKACSFFHLRCWDTNSCVVALKWDLKQDLGNRRSGLSVTLTLNSTYFNTSTGRKSLRYWVKSFKKKMHRSEPRDRLCWQTSATQYISDSQCSTGFSSWTFLYSSMALAFELLRRDTWSIGVIIVSLQTPWRVASARLSRPVLFPFSPMPCDLLSREPGLIKAGFHMVGARERGMLGAGEWSANWVFGIIT